MRKFLLCGVVVACAALSLAGCGPSETQKTPNKSAQADKARAAAEAIRFTENAEIDNIKRRLELTSQPGLLGYVALINKVGQVVFYSPVKGKLTSGSKRLTAPQHLIHGDRGQYKGDFVANAPSDEGTWGSSAPYVYFWTPGDQYIQTNLEYVYSDKPFRLTEEPLLLAVEGEPEPANQ